MTFLSGWGPIALAAGLTVPPLVALYFLKLRRQPLKVSSTLLWKRAVEDLQVNAPFQRIKNNLLLWLQLLVLLLAAFALGKPVIDAKESQKDSLILLIDQSASMEVEEEGGMSRLQIAKDQAKTEIDNLADGARAMVIGFSDRATIASSFETDKNVLKRRIDEIAATESVTTLSEAVTLAEAYMQNQVIGGETPGQDPTAQGLTGPVRVAILSDGNIADATKLTVKRLPTDDMQVISVGERSDNVAILSMDARRNYERPAMLEVFAMVRNFGPDPVTCDATLYINDENVDVQTMVLQPGLRAADAEVDADSSGIAPEDGTADTSAGGRSIMSAGPPIGSVASVAFDEVEYEGGGVVEVRLNVPDALAADNVAWTIVQPPRSVSVLLVAAGDVFLERALDALSVDVEQMTPAAFENASDDDLTEAGRSKWDVVIFENYSTKRLPPGNYIFMGGVPDIEGVSSGKTISNEILFNWDESHPILRYVAVDNIQVFQWSELTLPTDAEKLIEGETSPVLAYLARDGRQYLICAFGIIAEDEITGQPMLNTDWVIKPHFPVFLSNAIQYLAGSLSPTGMRNIRPGEPIQFPVLEGTQEIAVRRPDGESDHIQAAGFANVNYARTRRVGVYTAKPGIEGRDRFAVNLYSAGESDIAPRQKLTLSGKQLTASGEVQRVNKPVWPWILLAAIAVLALEWAVYSKRVFV
ncbi:MAG: BatA domain-containing protein [Phycisphaerales bacterium]|nr:BatA domain-containing protein [Phycisphaerales bacterium]